MDGRLADDPPDERVADERPGAVMDQDDVRPVAVEPGEAGQDRILAAGSAADDGPDLGERGGEARPEGLVREDEDDLSDARMRLECGQAPLEDGAAGEEGELLGRSEAPAFAGRDDDRRNPAVIAIALRCTGRRSSCRPSSEGRR